MATVEAGPGSYRDFVRIQVWRWLALVRGQIVRAHMKEIRQSYLETVLDIDGPDMEVVWSRDFLSRPLVRKLRKVGSEIRKIDLTLGAPDSSAGQASCQFDSARAERVVGPAVSSVDVNDFVKIEKAHDPAAPQACVNAVAELQLEKPDMISTEAQTDATSDVKIHLGHISNINKENQNKQSQDSETIASKSVRQPTTSPMMAFSGEQTNITNSFSHTTSSSVDGSSQISNFGKKRQSRNDLSSEKTDGSSTRASTFRSDMSTSEDVLLPEKLVCETFPSGAGSEKLVYESDKMKRCSAEVGAEEFMNRAGEDGICFVSHRSEKLRAAEKDGSFDPGTSSTEKDEVNVRPADSRKFLAGTSGHATMMNLPNDRDQLLKVKDTVTLELLWVLQAINSRKHYLKLKEQMQ